MQEIIKAKQESRAQNILKMLRYRGPLAVGDIAAAREEIVRYAASVFEPADIIEVRRLPFGKSTWHEAGRLAEATEFLLNDNKHSQHVYVGANPRRVEGGTRSKDVACARCLFVDFDGIGPDAARDRWHNAGLPAPTLTIASGHGVHAYWRLAKAITNLLRWTALQKKLISLLDSDKAIHDPARIMRLPGFINHKQPVAMCRIIDDDRERIYDLSLLLPLLESATAESGDGNELESPLVFAAQFEMPPDKNHDVVGQARLTAGKWPGVKRGQRNCKAFQRAAHLVKNLGLSEEQAWPILLEWNRKNKPPIPERELNRTLRNAGVYGRQPVDSEVAR